MKTLGLIAAVFLLFWESLPRILGQHVADLPPRGWNSYDSFCWTISEPEFLRNAIQVSQRLRPFGYEYAVVDYLWYRRKVPGAYVDSLGFDVIDKWGRMVPDPERWPSSIGGLGFSKVSDAVHKIRLKFGIHIMRGISTQAVNANTPILDITTGRAYKESGKTWYARDIGVQEMKCGWMKNGFMSVNTSLGAGRAFLRSLHQQYFDWGVDFLKNDCVFGDDLLVNEIKEVSQFLNGLNRPVLYSLSPGTSATPSMAKEIAGLVNMYRVTGDDWDTWGDVAAHFDVARDFAAAKLIGANGLKGRSWPDLDMLPLGWLTDPGSNDGPHRMCRLSIDEQRTQMTLWSMAKSPIMFGGDMRNLDEPTFRLITNPTLLEINSYSSNNMEFPHVTGKIHQELESNSLAGQLRNRQVLRGLKSDDRFLGLTSCKDIGAKGWIAKEYDDEVEQVCWTNSTRPFCLLKKKLLLESDETMMHEKLHLLATERREFCLSATPNRKLTAKEFKRGAFLPCKLDTNQMWELNLDGTLKSSYSGLCASVKKSSSKANAEGGVRSWLATGTKGVEVYLAFFNLNSGSQKIAARLSDIVKALPGENLKPSCTCSEVWSGQNFGVVKTEISMVVNAHGCALFKLICS